MSTSSAATASGRDQVPSSNPHLKTRICIFIVTRKDGTLFNVTMSQEDIIEICVILGHTHLLGVLQYLAMELVALFCTIEEMHCTSCSAVKATELQDEPIAIQTMAPLEHHIRAYIATVGKDPFKPQSPPSGEEDESYSPTGNPHLGGRTLHCLQTELGNLTDQELHQLMEDLCQEIALCELHAPPSNPHPTPWGEPSGSRNPNGDDQEVSFPRGGGWVPPRQQYPSPAPGWPDGGWVPQGPPLQPQRPALPNPVVGHLISTLALGLGLGTPRINTFSGKAMPGKTEVLFEQWNQEVQCIKDHYPESVVWESIVRSPKGAAADMAWYMGPTASISKILQQLTVIFGTVASFDVLMQNFYKVTQGNHQKVPSFATKLEGTLNQIRLKCPRRIADHKVMCHLEDWLFHRVCKHIRDSIRYLHSNPESTYSQLMVAARQVESEMEDAQDKVLWAMPKTWRNPMLYNVLDARVGVIWLGSVLIHQSC